MRQFFKSQQEMDRSLKAVREDLLPRMQKLGGKHGEHPILLSTFIVTLYALKESGVSRAELRQIGDVVFPEQAPALRAVEK